MNSTSRRAIIIAIILTARGQAAVVSVNGRETDRAPLQQYHLNMTSMWMVDHHGQSHEVFLIRQPLDDTRPVTLVEDSVFYFLYTREYNSAYKIRKDDLLRLRSSTFKTNRPTKVVIHGFWNSYQSDAVQVVREAYLNYNDVNVVAVDWSALAEGPWYVDAVSHTLAVGQQIALMINFLVSAGARVSDFHLIGHSLGAHVASFASNHVTAGRIRRITGLDPALPLFSDRPLDERLDPTDADLVDCIHTCGGYLGFFQPICSLDFYPNGGKASQPGCNWDFSGACSHSRSFRYFSVSVSNNFTARTCTSIDEVKRARCSGALGVMGDKAITSKPGLYYLETKGDYPYVKP